MRIGKRRQLCDKCHDRESWQDDLLSVRTHFASATKTVYWCCFCREANVGRWKHDKKAEPVPNYEKEWDLLDNEEEE